MGSSTRGSNPHVRAPERQYTHVRKSRPSYLAWPGYFAAAAAAADSDSLARPPHAHGTDPPSKALATKQRGSSTQQHAAARSRVQYVCATRPNNWRLVVAQLNPVEVACFNGGWQLCRLLLGNAACHPIASGQPLMGIPCVSWPVPSNSARASGAATWYIRSYTRGLLIAASYDGVLAGPLHSERRRFPQPWPTTDA
jgi:hypothetical protein